MKSLRGRLAKLERVAWLPRDSCPYCPPPGPIALVEADEEGNVLSGAYPLHCSRCGGPPGGVRSVVAVRPRKPSRDEAQPAPGG